MAIITRWRRPPESWCGYWPSRSPAAAMPTFSSSSTARSRACRAGAALDGGDSPPSAGRRSCRPGSAPSSAPGRSSPCGRRAARLTRCRRAVEILAREGQAPRAARRAPRGRRSMMRERRHRLAAAGLADEAERLAAPRSVEATCRAPHAAVPRGGRRCRRVRPSTSQERRFMALRLALRRDQRRAGRRPRRLIAKTSSAERRAREWRSARTRRTCRPWPRRSSGPRTAAAAARRGPRKESAASSRIALAASRVATTIRCGSDVGQHLAEDDARRRGAGGFRGRDVVEARAPAAWRCASPRRSGPTSAGRAPGSRSSSEPPTSATTASATRITGIARRVVIEEGDQRGRSCRRNSRRASPSVVPMRPGDQHHRRRRSAARCARRRAARER